jgi:hypothetical protein
MDCMRCHVANAGSTLGPETAQLNRVVSGTNQIDRLQALGLFETAPPKPYKAALITPYPTQGVAPPPTATAEQRARSYLHANCAFCHRPDALAFPFYDLRYDVSFKQMNLCNVIPMKGDAGVADSVMLRPTKPMESVLWLRMKALSSPGRMPPLASKVADEPALTVLGDWITSITTCPK